MLPPTMSPRVSPFFFFGDIPGFHTKLSPFFFSKQLTNTTKTSLAKWFFFEQSFLISHICTSGAFGKPWMKSQKPVSFKFAYPTSQRPRGLLHHCHHHHQQQRPQKLSASINEGRIYNTSNCISEPFEVIY